MDNFSDIEDLEDLILWVHKKEKDYTKIKNNLVLYLGIIYPDNELNSILEKDRKYSKLKSKIQETTRNCQIIQRKVEIFGEKLENEDLEFLKEYCQDILNVHRFYAKTWNGIAKTIQETINFIKEEEKKDDFF